MSRIKDFIYRIGCLMLCGCIIAGFIPAFAEANASDNKTIRIGWNEDNAFYITGKNGARSGYGYDYQQTVASYTGWEYKYVDGEWNDLMEKVESGEIDVMGCVSFTEERAAKLLYSDLPMGEERYFLYSNLSNTSISASDIDSIDGKRIGMLDGSEPAVLFSEWEEKNDISTKHIQIKNTDDALQKINNKEIDGFISVESQQWEDKGVSALINFGSSDIYYVINKDHPELKKQLDNAMKSIDHDNPFYEDELYQRYLTTQTVEVLTEDERSWVKNHGLIKVGVLTDDPGISVFDNDKEEFTGVVENYILHARNCLGMDKLSFDLIGYKTRQDQFKALKDGTIDMIFSVCENPYEAEQNNIILSDTTMSFNLAAITTDDTFDENATNTVAVSKGFVASKWFIEYNYPHWKIKEYDTFNMVKNAVRTGEADCFVVRSNQVLNYIKDNKLHSSFLTHKCNTQFAVNRDDVILMSILNKTIKTMPDSMLSNALSIYDNSDNKVTVSDFLRDNAILVIIIFLAIFMIVQAIIVGLLKLSRFSEMKAREAMEQAEKANAAKSNFLFNMSHDIRTPMNALLGYSELMKKDLTDPKLIGYQEKIEQSGNLLLEILNNVLDMARIESGRIELDENYSNINSVIEELRNVFEAAADKNGVTLNVESHVEHEHIMCDGTKLKEVFINLLSNAIKYTSAGGTVTVRTEELPCDRDGYVRLSTEIIDNGIGMSEEYQKTLFEPFTREHNTTAGKVAGTGLGMPIVKSLVDMMGGTLEIDSKLGEGTTVNVTIMFKKADEIYYDNKQAATFDKDDIGDIQGKHVLLAEDNDLNAEIATVLLEDLGLIVERVEDGVQCVDRMDKSETGTYDLILMDIQMPNLDGYKATQAIRRFSDRGKSGIPIIAMTANAFNEDKTTAASMKMDGHISKPIDVSQIKSEIQKALIRHQEMN